MAKIHILTGDSGAYSAKLHTAVPAGNNSVGVSWKACILGVNASPKTGMAIGTGAGQITQAEADQIAAGDVLEYDWSVSVNADGSAPGASTINAAADAFIAVTNARYACTLKYFGYTQG